MNQDIDLNPSTVSDIDLESEYENHAESDESECENHAESDESEYENHAESDEIQTNVVVKCMRITNASSTSTSSTSTSSITTRTDSNKKTNKPRKRAYNQRVDLDPEKALEYNNLGHEFNELDANGEKKWVKLFSDVLLADMEDEMASHPFTCCNWWKEDFRVFSGITFDDVSRRKDKNPCYTLKFPVNVPKDYGAQYCGISTFKVGCASRLCKVNRRGERCTSRLKILYISKTNGKTCDIYIWGKHSPTYYPTKLHLKPKRRIVNETLALIDAKAKPSAITEHHKEGADPNDVSLVIPPRPVASMKSYRKTKKIRS
jgi:hypothetical protein